MKVQEYVLKPKKDFNSTHIFECGQCFRWNLQESGNYIGVVKNSVIEVIEKEDEVIFRGVSESNLKDIVIEYFNLEMNYREIKNKLSRVDNYLKESIEFGNAFHRFIYSYSLLKPAQVSLAIAS